jgi:hypothetical protein
MLAHAYALDIQAPDPFLADALHSESPRLAVRFGIVEQEQIDPFGVERKHREVDTLVEPHRAHVIEVRNLRLDQTGADRLSFEEFNPIFGLCASHEQDYEHESKKLKRYAHLDYLTGQLFRSRGIMATVERVFNFPPRNIGGAATHTLKAGTNP